jgi:hypothetical protein
MVPEIELLHKHFAGKKWNTETQTAFMQLLSEENFFNGEGANDPAFSARDRINRAPKSLGFVLLSSGIQLTNAGEELITANRKEEIFLRQLLKFQLPSPFHIPTEKAAKFNVKPYLEMFRLIRHFGSLSFDEIMLFGLQIVDYKWNTWRAMTMLDGGNVSANLKFDDFGNPMNTAQGNMADIVCDYGDFGLTVEVTMQSGQRQYETEGEPVTRHLAKLKKETNQPAYCLFIAPEINEACIAHFFMLHKVAISYYGGVSTIIPLSLSVFQKMVTDSYKASYIPEPKHIQRFFEFSNEKANTSANEKDWYKEITNKALNWLA